MNNLRLPVIATGRADDSPANFCHNRRGLHTSSNKTG